MSEKLKVATTSLAGCFGCHMSLLDIDARIMDLVQLVEFDRSPLTDIKTVGTCDIGIIEGGAANTENIEVLQMFRDNCSILVSLGACALNGGVPAMRNQFDLKACLDESFDNGAGIVNPGVPDDPELPPLLNKVQPLHELVKIDYFIPGCPPPAEVIYDFLARIIEGKSVEVPYAQIRYD
ncbi:NADP oxidoreductase [Solemya velum gill symbiont]|uniref:NADH-quinone oxidoreductase subunit B family protein n=1 Tax=Solemya velum gill symbiont TaxID=2340 RepID=UPI0009986879|nr:NADP oxidoreductase [Solemya velum gill symbiont]OOY98290.1 NADP oxidoreductase [Solemya velum gill symbiont]OOZ00608.1 NADP oxidoreductase [Solemya velum gill symbiont]OOZ02782.1 NADP oxidoreductase [Solemya velum gill symbiont]OOZ04817.1 NADP oxidoreductase [Solemya velum gill symbiont]OOZ07058.1 NADP oxidoreductase [Solemya velum gill symbiont]